jgi:hypothetical protein
LNDRFIYLLFIYLFILKVDWYGGAGMDTDCVRGLGWGHALNDFSTP